MNDPKRPVVIGIIDDGIAFANARFCRGDGSTRVQWFWNQNSNIPGATPPPLFPLYGHEIDKVQIDKAMSDSRFPPLAGPVNESKVYRLCKLVDYSVDLHKAAGWRIAHGAHTLDLAAGYSMEADRSDRPIIAVQLPVASTANQSGADLVSFVSDAIDYILARAADLTRQGEDKLPVVINFSYAVHSGPHDGTFILERTIKDRVDHAGREVQIVLPAGNTLQSRCHARITFAGKPERHLSLRLQPDNLKASTVTVWLPFGPNQPPKKSRLTLTLTRPDNTIAATADEQPWPLPAEPSSPSSGADSLVTYGFDSVTRRGHFVITINPTARLLYAPAPGIEPITVASSGLWTITLRNHGLGRRNVIQAWIERDGPIYGYPRQGRQAYFDDPDYIRFDRQGRPIYDDPAPASVKTYVRRAGMINGIATGTVALVAGGFIVKTLEEDTFSAGGPVASAQSGSPPANALKPDALLPSDDTRVHTGILAAGTQSGSLVALSGTSMSCAQLTRQCANWLSAHESAGHTAIKILAQQSEAGLPANKAELPQDRSGWGRIVGKSVTKGWRTRYWD